MQNMASRLKTLRKSENLTQMEFGKRIHVSNSYVSKIETGIDVPTDMLVKLITYEFGVSWTWLTSGEGEMYIAKKSMKKPNVNEHKDFGKSVAKRLIELEMTQKELASLVGISHRHVSLIVNGNSPGLKHRKKIRAVLKMLNTEKELQNDVAVN